MLYKDRTQEDRARLDLFLHGPPSEADWMNDPASLGAQLPPDAMGGEAP